MTTLILPICSVRLPALAQLADPGVGEDEAGPAGRAAAWREAPGGGRVEEQPGPVAHSRGQRGRGVHRPGGGRAQQAGGRRQHSFSSTDIAQPCSDQVAHEEAEQLTVCKH